MPDHHLADAEPRNADFPAAYKRMANLQMAIDQGGLDVRISHLVKLRASQINGCAYCIDLHVRDAVEDGIEQHLLHLTHAWREVDAFTAREQAALALTEAVTLVSEGNVPRAVWDAAAAVFSEEELPVLLWQIIAINAWNRASIATRKVPESLAPGDG